MTPPETMYPNTLREEELKNKVAADVFGDYDCTRILGSVDFCVSPRVAGIEDESLLWAEAKAGVRDDFAPLFAQLILTLGKARTFDEHLPPPFLGAFDCEKIAFVPYHEVVDIFYQNDFNWNVAPSDSSTREFGLILDRIRPLLASNLRVFRFDDDAIELDAFVHKAFRAGSGGPSASLNVTRNNFVFVYQKWARNVKPSIAIDWENAKRRGLLDADFFLADLLSKDGATLVEKLYVVLRGDHYDLDRTLDEMGLLVSKRAEFNDGQKAHQLFWNRYRRPPKKEYWGYISERRDLLVPQDVRERKGSFFTPQIWVEKAQEAIADVLGENWQDECDVWDCAAGTANLLAGLQNKYRVWASTLDRADVEVMRERIKNGANLLESHVFQFDFLNDPLDSPKIPQGLRDIIADPERRKKLVVFINPPYAEAASTKTKTGTGANKGDVARNNAVFNNYGERMGGAANELFAQFFIRIYSEISGCKVGMFSKLKALCAPNFEKYRALCAARLESLFLVPADTFDNVNGQFPIGFQVFDTGVREPFAEITASVFDRNGNPLPPKTVYAPPPKRLLMDWLKTLHDKAGEKIAVLRMLGSDMQNNGGVFLTLHPSESDIRQRKTCDVTKNNFLSISVYLAVRHCIEADWQNDRDQFLWPADTWRTDYEFQLDCLVFTLFHGQNRISCQIENGKWKMENDGRGRGIPIIPQSHNLSESSAPPRLCVEKNNPATTPVNHWIPFPESEVDAKDAYKSHFMVDFLKSILATKITENTKDLCAPLCSLWLKNTSSSLPQDDLFADEPSALRQFSILHSQFSIAAARVMDAGRRLWRYYHAQPGALPDASFYDIRAHFQGFKPNGHMNPDSSDAEYTRLIGDLRAAMKALAAKLAPKVREYGFLR